jgi:hypothetical protein
MDELLDAWMDLGPTVAPQRIAEATREAIRTTAKRRATWWQAWRFPFMNSVARLWIVAAVVVLVAVIGINLLPASVVPGGAGPMVSPSPSRSSTPSPTPQPTPRPADVLQVPIFVDFRYSVSVQGVPLSFSVSNPGWESHGRPYISKSTQGSQGAEAIIYWASFPDSLSAHPCARLLDPSVGQSAADLAATVSTAPGTELVTGPSDVMVGGRPAKHVVLTVHEDVGCDPGYFYSWEPFLWGALWPETIAGDTIRVWVVDVDGTLLFIAGETKPDASAGVLDEIERIVESIRFE